MTEARVDILEAEVHVLRTEMQRMEWMINAMIERHLRGITGTEPLPEEIERYRVGLSAAYETAKRLPHNLKTSKGWPFR